MLGAEFEWSSQLRAAGFRHAFFTRRGGASAGAFASLNFSYSVGDSSANVDDNFARAAGVLGIPEERAYFLSQVHGRALVTLSGDEDRQATFHVEGDALTSRAPGVACGVRTADCVPILLANEATGAVAAVHAGWRGTEQNIAQVAVHALAEGSDARALIAAVGPHISVSAFEVSDEVAERLFVACPMEDVVRRDLGPKPHVDLRRIIRHQLERAGVSGTRIDDVPGCTHDEPERYFSYRRDGKVSGRHWSAIVPRT
jgi:YfiH family protein